MKTKTIFRIVFIVWAGIWLLFLIRGLVKGEARDYKNLFGKTGWKSRIHQDQRIIFNEIQMGRPRAYYIRTEGRYLEKAAIAAELELTHTPASYRLIRSKYLPFIIHYSSFYQLS